MKLSLFGFLLVGTSALAATNAYHLNLDLNLNGKHLSSPDLVVKEGSTGTVTEQTGNTQTFIDIIPSEGVIENHHGILMKFTIGTIAANGVRTVNTHSQVMVKENSPALLTFRKPSSNDAKLSLSVTAHRQTI